jgi:hypothetical protein
MVRVTPVGQVVVALALARALCGCQLFALEGSACAHHGNCPGELNCCDGTCHSSGCDPVCADDSECKVDQACHPQRKLCAAAIRIGCLEADEICPTTTQTGDTCPSAGSFIPCINTVDDCSAGCRTCLPDRTWSPCTFGSSTCTPTNGGVEACDGVDNDCNEIIDDAAPGATGCMPFRPDRDGDSFGADDDSRCLCAASGDYQLTTAGDCDDNSFDRHPGATEVCDDADDDCDGTRDNSPPLVGCACANGMVGPALGETCNNQTDDDCNGAIDENCTCSASQYYCDVNGRVRHLCNAGGTGAVSGADVTCAFLCAQGSCVLPANLTEAQVRACDSATLRLTPAMGSSVTFTTGGISCLPHCGDGSTLLIVPALQINLPSGQQYPLFCLTSLMIPSGVDLGFDGVTRAPVFLVDGDVQIIGNVDFAGAAAPTVSTLGGPGGGCGPGGWDGADGCLSSYCDGLLGFGPGAGGGGLREGTTGGGGGGGANYGDGGQGGPGDMEPTSRGSAGTAYATSCEPMQGGSGGGSGADGTGADASGPGGGGGGALQISARGDVVVNGVIWAHGGNGGSVSPAAEERHGAGGGGSGGMVVLEGRNVAINGNLVVDGGNGGQVLAASVVGGAGATGGALDGGDGGGVASSGGSGGGGGSGRTCLRGLSLPTCRGNSPTGSCSAASF